MKTIGLISANYNSTSFDALLETRSLASLPFGGRYRLIDFALSNMSNSGITTVGIIAPHDSGSLTDHIGVGSAWSLSRKRGGMFIMPGSSYGMQSGGSRFLLRDIIKSRQFFEKDDADYVIMAGSTDVWNIDFKPLIEQHSASGKPMTMVYKRVEKGEEYNGYFLSIEDDGTVESIHDEGYARSDYFADCLIVDREYMLEFMNWFEPLEYMDMIQIIRNNIENMDIDTYEFTGYLGKIKNHKDFLKVNQDVTDYDIRNELFCNPDRPIFTKAQDEAPVFHYKESHVRNSLVSAGCRIEGTVENSIIFRSVNIGKGAVVKNSVIMMHSNVGEGAILENVIADKYVTINDGVRIYAGEDEPVVISKGKTV